MTSLDEAWNFFMWLARDTCDSGFYVNCHDSSSFGINFIDDLMFPLVNLLYMIIFPRIFVVMRL